MKFLTAAFTIACLFVGTGSFCDPSYAQGSAEQVRAIKPPREPLPAEAASASVTKFSFIVYGDTRGRRDGKDLQYEHSLVVDAMLNTIARLDSTPYPIRFVLQTGDAVVNGRDVQQWNVSFIDLINRLTTEGGIPYFLAPGNHDVTGAPTKDEPRRLEGLRNYLSAVSSLIPPDGAPRRLSGYPTYAFGYGNAFFIAFDSNIAGDTTQFAWVKGQLEGLDRTRFPIVIAYCHHPGFSSGGHGGNRVEAPTAVVRANYLPLFRRHRVKMVFSGHEHFFEHWVERYQDDGGMSRRMEHVVTGGGGAPLYVFTGVPDVSEYVKAGAAEKVRMEQLVRPGATRGDNPYHYVIVKVDGEELEMEVVGVDWGRGYQPYKGSQVELTN